MDLKEFAKNELEILVQNLDGDSKKLFLEDENNINNIVYSLVELFDDRTKEYPQSTKNVIVSIFTKLVNFNVLNNLLSYEDSPDEWDVYEEDNNILYNKRCNAVMYYKNENKYYFQNAILWVSDTNCKYIGKAKLINKENNKIIEVNSRQEIRQFPFYPVTIEVPVKYEGEDENKQPKLLITRPDILAKGFQLYKLKLD